MAETIEKIETIFDRFKTLQESHIQSLEKDEPDTKRLLFERERAFENLRNDLSAIPGVSLSESCKRQVSEILKKDQMLAEKIKIRQHELSKSINNGQKGKKALKGYQGLSDRSSRFMGITG